MGCKILFYNPGYKSEAFLVLRLGFIKNLLQITINARIYRVTASNFNVLRKMKRLQMGTGNKVTTLAEIPESVSNLTSGNLLLLGSKWAPLFTTHQTASSPQVYYDQEIVSSKNHSACALNMPHLKKLGDLSFINSTGLIVFIFFHLECTNYYG